MEHMIGLEDFCNWQHSAGKAVSWVTLRTTMLYQIFVGQRKARNAVHGLWPMACGRNLVRPVRAMEGILMRLNQLPACPLARMICLLCPSLRAASSARMLNHSIIYLYVPLSGLLWLSLKPPSPRKTYR